MILISHRGNINGKKPHLENQPNYIDNAINETERKEILVSDELIKTQQFNKYGSWTELQKNQIVDKSNSFRMS